MFKTCNRCKEFKSIDEFHVLKRGKYGRNSICIDCRKKRKSETFYENEINIICSNCNTNKSSKFFYKNVSSKNGYQTYCKECQKKSISQSGSKLNNFINIIFKRFMSKYKDKQIIFNQNDILKKYNEQQGKCKITGHEMSHVIDNKQRIDNIWNISILIDNDKTEYDYDDFSLVINMVYSVKKIYKLDGNNILKVYNDLLDNIDKINY